MFPQGLEEIPDLGLLCGIRNNDEGTLKGHPGLEKIAKLLGEVEEIVVAQANPLSVPEGVDRACLLDPDGLEPPGNKK
jgi:hypothetical protein